MNNLCYTCLFFIKQNNEWKNPPINAELRAAIFGTEYVPPSTHSPDTPADPVKEKNKADTPKVERKKPVSIVI